MTTTPISSRRRQERGAAFVEALIVISFLILSFFGLIFFREFYMTELLAMRTARAGVLAYAEIGCEDDVLTPGSWLDQDIGTLIAGQPTKGEDDAVPEQQPKDERGAPVAAQTQGNESTEVMSRVNGKANGLSSGGDGILNVTASSEFSGEVWVGTQDRSLLSSGEKKTVFEKTATSMSILSCTDPPRDEVEDLIDYIAGIFKGF